MQPFARSIEPAFDDLDRRFVELLASGRYAPPVFPRVAQLVLEAAQDVRRGAADVARLVEKDPVLCAKVLAAASSALYGGTQVGAIWHAVARIGTAEVACVATAIALEGAVFKPGPFDDLLVECWRSCVTTGMFAKEIARTRRRGIDVAFLCGLLHLVGRPIALDVLARMDVRCSSERARVVVSRHEASLGASAVRQWGMSRAVVAAVAYANGGVPPAELADEVHVVRLASAFARWALAVGTEPERARVLSDAIDASPSVAALALSSKDLLAIRDRAAAIAASLDALC